MKHFFILTISFFALAAKGQGDSLAHKHYHEPGADITGLLKQFIGPSNALTGNGELYQPVYYFSYRYHLKKTNIRFGAGGSYFKNGVYGYTVNGEDRTFYNTSSSFRYDSAMSGCRSSLKNGRHFMVLISGRGWPTTTMKLITAAAVT